MPIIHFVSGFKKEISEDQWIPFLKRLNNNSGIKYWGCRDTGDIIPFNAGGIAIIERCKPDVEPNDQTESDGGTTDEPAAEEAVAVDVEEPKPVEKPKDPAKEVIAEMTRLSDCGKNGHTGQQQIIHYQTIHNVKKGTISKRFFPICGGCGVRGRYIKAADLPDEIKDNAKLWEKE